MAEGRGFEPKGNKPFQQVSTAVYNLADSPLPPGWLPSLINLLGLIDNSLNFPLPELYYSFNKK